MTDATHDQLEQAYRLINQDEADKALRILRPIVAAQPDNADAWWLLANAVSDPQEAQNALDNVLRLKPDHAEAAEHRRALVNEYPELASSPSRKTPPAQGSAFDQVDDLFGNTPEPAGAAASDFDNLGDLFGSTPEPTGAAVSDGTAASDFGNLDELFGNAPEPVDSTAASPDFGSLGEDPVMANNSNNDLDDLFSTGSTFQPDADLDALFGDANQQMNVLDEDPFSSTSHEPTFLQNTELEPVPAAKPAPAEKKPKPEKKPKVKEPPQPLDPLEIERRANSRTSPFVRVLLVLLIILIIGGGVTAAYLSGLFGPRNGPDQTPVPVTGVALVGTAPATQAATGGSFQAIVQAFADSKYTNVQAGMVQSSLGDTLQVQVCDAPGPNLQAKVNQAMDLVATEAVKVRDTIKGAGVQFVSCAKPDVILYRAVVPMSAVSAYVDGAMKDHKTFRAAWKTA